MRRYNRTGLINGGTSYATPQAVANIRAAVASGGIPTRLYVCAGAQRLDTIAMKELGSSALWWVIAATSGIGWALQVPPGTRLLLPAKLSDIMGIIG